MHYYSLVCVGRSGLAKDPALQCGTVALAPLAASDVAPAAHATPCPVQWLAQGISRTVVLLTACCDLSSGPHRQQAARQAWAAGNAFQAPPSVPRVITGSSFPHVPPPPNPAATHSHPSRVHHAYKQGGSNMAKERGERQEAAAGSSQRRQRARPAAAPRRPPSSDQGAALPLSAEHSAYHGQPRTPQARPARGLHRSGDKPKKSARSKGRGSERPGSAPLAKRPDKENG